MKTFTFFGGELLDGIKVVEDDRKNKSGNVVFLGEDGGKNSWYQRVQLDRFSPPKVANGRLYDAYIKTITIPEKNGKPEHTFSVLAYDPSDSGSVLIRINTKGTYTKRSQGHWKAVVGEPELLLAGKGNHSNGSFWTDELVTMAPGDVLMVKPEGGHKSSRYALFFENGDLSISLFEDWKAGNHAVQLQANAYGELDLRFKTMRCFTFGPTTKWELKEGIDTIEVPNGRGIKLGPRDNSWRSSHHVVVGVPEVFPPVVTRAAIASVDGANALVTFGDEEQGKYLVRIDTERLRKAGRTGAVVFTGSPELLAQGTMEHGTKNIQAHRDELWVVGEGDCLRIGQVHTEDFLSSDYALFVEDGVLALEKFTTWMYRDGEKNPNRYIEEGWAHIKCVPQEWVGKVVAIFKVDRDYASNNTSVLVSTSPLILNSGWNENPPKDWSHRVRDEVAWLQLLPDLNPEEEWKKQSERTYVRLCDPLIPDREKRVATVKTIAQKPAWTGGPLAWEYSLTFTADAEDVHEVTLTKGEEIRREEAVLGSTTKVHTIALLSRISLSSGRDGEIYGELMVSRAYGTRGRGKGQDFWQIHDDHVTDEEFESVQGQLDRLETKAKELWALICSKLNHVSDSFTASDGQRYVADVIYGHTTYSVYKGYVSRYNKVESKYLYESGALQEWADSLDIDFSTDTEYTVPSSTQVELAGVDIPMFDFEINLGKNHGRQESTVWVIDESGNVFDERSGIGTQLFTNIPVSALVLRHQWSNYGYTHTEIFEVWYLPEELSEKQLATATEIAVEFERKYFFGSAVTWDINKVGQRVFQTPYKKQLSYDEIPVTIGSGYTAKKLRKDPDMYEDPDHPVNLLAEVRKVK